MSLDFKVSQTDGDMVISSTGLIEEQTGVDEIVQRVRIRLNKQLGEWKFNLDSGIPWMPTDDSDGILGSRNSEKSASQYIANVASQTDGVTGVNVVDFRFDTVSREFIMQLELATIYGSAIIVI